MSQLQKYLETIDRKFASHENYECATANSKVNEWLTTTPELEDEWTKLLDEEPIDKPEISRFVQMNGSNKKLKEVTNDSMFKTKYIDWILRITEKGEDD